MLVNDAADEAGSVAVNVTKKLGGHVTAACSSKDVGKDIASGADKVMNSSEEYVVTSQKKLDVAYEAISTDKTLSSSLVSDYCRNTVRCFVWSHACRQKRLLSFIVKARRETWNLLKNRPSKI